MTVLSDAALLEGDFDDVAERTQPLLHLVRSSRLQKDAAIEVDAIVARMHRIRIDAILDGNTVVADGMLALSCVGRAFACELRMYLLLKSDEPEQAWNMLVTAQEQIDAAMRADPLLRTFVEKSAQLRSLEDRLFPPQTFTSMGMLARRQDCSICRQDYDHCDHIAGRPYLGRFCSMVPVEVSMDHVAIVDDPADRRCRITSQGVPGVGMRNLMTWEVIPGDDGEETPDNLMRAVLAVTTDADGD